MAKFQIYQIYYDKNSFDMLDDGFIPLDNTISTNRGWFEFEPILNYLNKSHLEEDTWYGFLSPKFVGKSCVNSKRVKELLNQQDQYADVALFHTDWTQICYFKNPWEQGDIWHPGLKSFSQKFFDYIGFIIDLEDIYTDMTSSVFSNYIIAKKKFWMEWKIISNKFFNYVEELESISSGIQLTPYGDRSVTSNMYPIKAFVQERFAPLVLAKNSFKVMAIDHSFGGALNTPLFSNTVAVRELLKKCDFLKNQYRTTSNPQFLKDYYDTRSKIKFNAPVL